MIKDSAKTILCYGDSNTWGAIPNTDKRHPRSIRWPGVLQNLLGDDFEVVSEGLPGRTFVAAVVSKPWKAGITLLPAIIRSAHPIDWIIIMLATNDVKTDFNLSPADIASHLTQTLELIENTYAAEQKPRMLIICPPSVIKPESAELDVRMSDGPEKFKTLPTLFKDVAAKYNCAFINAGDYISSSKIDGYHLDANAHLRLAEVVAGAIKK